MEFTIAVLQFKPSRKNVKKNIKKIKNLIEGVEADLIVLPELANTGYLYETDRELAPFSEKNDGAGPFLSSLIELAEKTKGVIAVGYSEKDGQRLFNSACALSSDGIISNYRKTHLYDHEKELFQPGDTGFSTFEWRGIKIGMMICFDWIFPEAIRTLALAGAQIVAHPANLVLPYCQNAMVTRSIENRVFTITANRTGEERLGSMKLTFTGVSQITDPSGSVRYRGPKNKPTIHIMTIDPDQALNKALNQHNNLFNDRRPDLYQIE